LPSNFVDCGPFIPSAHSHLLSASLFSHSKLILTMATFDANPSTTRSGQDTYNSPSATSRDKWSIDPTTLPSGYTYKLHSQIGNGPITPTVLTQGTPVRPGAATNNMTLYMTYAKEGSTEETQSTSAVPATTGASLVNWTPGAGQAGAPQPTLTITVATGLGGDI
jgi:hypothetical protein